MSGRFERNRHVPFAPGDHCDGDYDRRNDRTRIALSKVS